MKNKKLKRFENIKIWEPKFIDNQLLKISKNK